MPYPDAFGARGNRRAGEIDAVLGVGRGGQQSNKIIIIKKRKEKQPKNWLVTPTTLERTRGSGRSYLKVLDLPALEHAFMLPCARASHVSHPP